MSADSTTSEPARGEGRLDPLAVCTFSPDELTDRLAWIRAEILPHAVACERSSNGVVWELEDAAGLAEKLDRLVALERECCSSIVFAHAGRARTGAAVASRCAASIQRRS
jgi:hypothetical protein